VSFVAGAKIQYVSLVTKKDHGRTTGQRISVVGVVNSGGAPEIPRVTDLCGFVDNTTLSLPIPNDGIGTYEAGPNALIGEDGELESEYPYLIMDALGKARENGVIRSRALLVAIGIDKADARCSEWKWPIGRALQAAGHYGSAASKPPVSRPGRRQPVPTRAQRNHFIKLLDLARVQMLAIMHDQNRVHWDVARVATHSSRDQDGTGRHSDGALAGGRQTS
jgi:hypothetical protein